MKRKDSIKQTFKKTQVLSIAVISFSFLQSSITSVEAVQLKVTVENVAEDNGVFFSPFWLGFHDGSFNTFDPGTEASVPLEVIAEDGIVGLEPTVPAFEPLVQNAQLFGATLPEPEETIANLFATTTSGGIQAIAYDSVFGLSGGTKFSFLVDLDPQIQNSLSYASMVVPTHDGFVADIDPISLFSASGVFQPQNIEIRGSDVYDAGTEENAEDILTTPISFNEPAEFFGAVRQGTPEQNLISKHPLLKAQGEGGFLDFPQFANADFSRNPDQVFARISVQTVPEPSTFLGTGLLLGVAGFLKRKKKMT